MTLSNLRRDYSHTQLSEKDISDNPFTLFHTWFQDALNTPILDPHAATLATASRLGHPSARIILIKDIIEDTGFVFYTHYDSHKAHDMLRNPGACILFYWDSLSRQVRIEGTITKTARKVSEDYFHSRPRESQLSAYVSHQSHKVKDRDILEHQFNQAEKKFNGTDIPCPKNWGGIYTQA